VSALLADAYSLASNLCTRLNDDALAWVTADRARSAARASGGGTSLAEAARVASIAMRRHGHREAATTLLTETTMGLGADSGEPDLIGTYGSLLCTAADTAAQHGDRSRALDLMGEAEQAAHRLDGMSSRTTFSAADVDIYQIGVRTALGDTGAALDHARRIDIRTLPTAERQARFCADTARAWQRFGDNNKCYHALRIAEHIAPEEVHRPAVRSLVTGLLLARGSAPSGLRKFAGRIGATA
jgi:ATP/maltotriose-dependent transcriptional regulator MalT